MERDIRTRILGLERIFMTGKPYSAPQLICELGRRYDIQTTRKTIYQDIAALGMFMNICDVRVNGRHKYQLLDMEDME